MRTLTNEVSTDPLLHAKQMVTAAPSLRVDLDLVAGDRTAIQGYAPGITVLLRTLARLEEPADGQLWWGEREVTHLKPRRLNKYRAKVAYVPANPYTLFDYYSPVERLFSRAEYQQANSEDLAQAVGLSPVIVQQQIKDLSGVSLIRVALMRVVLGQPDVLLFDDAFCHVAPESWPALIDTLKNIVGPQQALLVASQQQAVVAQFPKQYRCADNQLVQN